MLRGTTSSWRVLAISPGAQCSGLTSYEADADAIALRVFAVVGHRDANLDARVARFCATLGRVLTRERPSLVVIEEPPEGHRVPPLCAALGAVHATVAAAGVPVVRRGVVGARRVICGALRPISPRTAAVAIASRFPRVACWLPTPTPTDKTKRVRTAADRHWSRAWTAAVIGLAAVEERGPAIQPTRAEQGHP